MKWKLQPQENTGNIILYVDFSNKQGSNVSKWNHSDKLIEGTQSLTTASTYVYKQEYLTDCNV